MKMVYEAVGADRLKILVGWLENPATSFDLEGTELAEVIRGDPGLQRTLMRWTLLGCPKLGEIAGRVKEEEEILAGLSGNLSERTGHKLGLAPDTGADSGLVLRCSACGKESTSLSQPCCN
jgi:hypothetical protein